MQPLTSPNLRNISSSKLRKDDLIARYIKGQKGYVSGYARDSRNMLGNISEEPPNGEKQVLASGFATPVLKPRVPPTGTKNVVKTATTSNSPLKSTSHAKRSRSTDKRPPKSGASKNEAENVDPRKHSVGKPIRKRPMTPDPDEERGARLAERRERKRAKKAITNPKDVEDASERSDAEEDPGDSRSSKHLSKGKTGGRKKEGKKLKVPAGLALMNGFSAKNLGKNRLTLKPEPQSGVFNKGKASAKVKVDRKADKRAKGLDDSVFSEFRFLNKSEPPDVLPRQKELETGSALSLDEPRSVRDKNSDIGPFNSRTESKAQDASEMDSSPVFPDVDNLSASAQGQDQESQVWDIEVEGRSLPSEASSVSLGSCAQEGTVLLNMPIFQCPKDQRHEESEAKTGNAQTSKSTNAKNVDVNARACPVLSCRSSSIGPSESASQAQLVKLDHAATFGNVSRFFPQPPHVLGDSLSEIVDAKAIVHSDQQPVMDHSQLSYLSPHHSLDFDDVAFGDGQLVPTDLPPADPEAPSLSLHADMCDVVSGLPMGSEVPDDCDPLDHGAVSPALSVNSLELALQTYEADHVLDAHLPEPISAQEYVPYEYCASDAPQTIDHAYAGLYAEDHDSVADGLDTIDESAFWRLKHAEEEPAGLAIHSAAGDWQDHEGYYEDHVAPDTVPGDNMREIWTYRDGAASNAPSDVYEYWPSMPTIGDISLEEEYGMDLVEDEITFDDTAHDSLYDCGTRPQTGSSQLTLPDDVSSTSDDGTIDGPSLLPLFSEGRSLLLGFSKDHKLSHTLNSSGNKPAASKAEKDVATSLKDHWFPQRL